MIARNFHGEKSRARREALAVCRQRRPDFLYLEGARAEACDLRPRLASRREALCFVAGAAGGLAAPSELCEATGLVSVPLGAGACAGAVERARACSSGV